ncbi:HD domain-containing protein [Candidatus Solincola tengchongensis]|uniref:HD domain-containing protein n=1 Tax=Candidatus Solincola tengchongensis TaxID=2900693 RepID=UPI00257EDDFD|nr:HD domain-containing protein [Candidatus Solincola tengchongensis]
MLPEEYREAREISLRIAREVDPPRFYVDKSEEVEASRLALEAHPTARTVLSLVEERGERLGHGVAHVVKVAVDAGALVLIETGFSRGEARRERYLLLAHLAGLLHDIRREERDHARKGAEEAGRILLRLGLQRDERQAVVQAIRNHEAFRPEEPLEDPDLQILSDALYDADKFRWGPDNFTETLWSMVGPTGIPIAALLRHFRTGMEGIMRIADTFRTPTGRQYGPDFIARGLEIGERLYRELAGMYGLDDG